MRGAAGVVAVAGYAELGNADEAARPAEGDGSVVFDCNMCGMPLAAASDAPAVYVDMTVFTTLVFTVSEFVLWSAGTSGWLASGFR